jgi:hypothetical protein
VGLVDEFTEEGAVFDNNSLRFPYNCSQVPEDGRLSFSITLGSYIYTMPFEAISWDSTS